jgi:hypothetical protein
VVLKKSEIVIGSKPERVIMALFPVTWPIGVLSSFCSQYGNPMDYPYQIRARLLGTYGDVMRMLDNLHVLILASHGAKKKDLKPWLPDDVDNRGKQLTPELKQQLDKFAYEGVEH